jgi:hypothetical protein
MYGRFPKFTIGLNRLQTDCQTDCNFARILNELTQLTF